MRSEILGKAHRPSEEERALDEECGSSIGVLGKSLPGIPHQDYRVLVMQEVLKRSSHPTTKDYALAKIKVDKALENQGIGIIIPAARPGRRTV